MDITKPVSRANYRYQKARITGNLSISHSPIRVAIYRYHIARLEWQSIDIT